MRKRLVAILIMVFVLVIAGCGNSNSTEEPIEADGQMTENIEQTDTDENVSTGSVADYPDSNMADEDTITFTGTIIENTIDSLVPVICVKPPEDVIPYDAVFFELPDDEAEWASQIGSVVIITCDDTFTEKVPHYGRLISIVGWKSENVTKEEGTYVYNEESQISEIALYFSLKNISPTRATLVFEQYDADAPKGELTFGEGYVIEVKKNDKWEKVPAVIESYGFDAVAIMIKSGDTVERELDWEWLYGELEPGEYRIGKDVNDFIESGNFDKYMVYAHFIIN